MSGSEPKSKDTDKIKFFKIDSEGDIAPAFPKEGQESPPPTEEGSFARIEPIFGATPPAETPGPAAPEVSEPNLADFAPFATLPEMESPAEPPPESPTHSGVGPSIPPSTTAPQLEVQADLLKPQIESITRLSKGGSISNDQIDVLRKYISLKEAEVRDLRDQEQQYQAVLKKVSTQLDTLTRKHRDTLGDAEKFKRETEALKSELATIREKHQGELAVQKNEFEDRARRSGNYDAQAEEFYKKREEWKEKVREELKRIKLKERELENKHELLKRDMQALLDSKDKHVLELKKKSDALEYEQEALEDRLRKANIVMAAIDSRKRRLIETMRLAISLLESIDSVEGISDEESRKAG